MPSALSMFRKNQRALMAVFGVLLMIAFLVTGFAGGLEDIIAPRRGDPLIATSARGNFYASDAVRLVQLRRAAQQFLFRVKLESFAIQLFQKPIDALGQQDLQLLERFMVPRISNEVYQVTGPLEDRPVIENKLMADEASRRGVVFDDDAIRAYINAQTGDQLTDDRLRIILGQLRYGERALQSNQLFEALRIELLAHKMQELELAEPRQSPLERWEYYARLKRRVTAEIVAVPVSSLLAETSAPSEVELRKLYNEYKNDEPVPGSAEPGFKVPHEAAFQYFRAEFEKFVDEKSITDDEIAAYYEKNKDTRFSFTSLDDEEPAAGTEEKKADDKKEEKPADEKKADTKRPEAAKQPAGEKKPAEDKKPAAEAPKTGAEPAPAKTEPKPEAKSGLDRTRRSTTIRFASYSAAADEPAKEDTKPEAKPAGDVPAAKEAAPATTPPAAATPALTPSAVPAGEAPAVTPPALNAPGTVPPPAVKAPLLVDKFELPRDVREGATPTHDPLWKVRDRIRRELAVQKAGAKMDAALGKFKLEMQRYARNRTDTEVKNMKASTPAPLPPLPTFDNVPKVEGVTSGALAMTSAVKVDRTQGLGSTTIVNRPFVDYAYRSLNTFQAMNIDDDAGNRYVFWKTEDVPEHVLSFEEARPEVEKAWKFMAARKLAQAKAKQLADEATASKKSLKEFFADKGYEVTESHPFSWLTGGSAGMADRETLPEVSEVDGVIDAGNDFMQSVFDLKVGDIGVAENQPHTYQYIVRITSQEKPDSALRELFAADKTNEYSPGLRVAQQQAALRWRNAWLKRIQLQWQRPSTDYNRDDG
ncbi:MAG: hypothetical protein JSS27_16830 [Planctomycetes bacterium]|nr:hypothetical protein [Planctomycetota bacterium]